MGRRMNPLFTVENLKVGQRFLEKDPAVEGNIYERIQYDGAFYAECVEGPSKGSLKFNRPNIAVIPLSR